VEVKGTKGYTKVRWYIGFLLGFDQKKGSKQKKEEKEKEMRGGKRERGEAREQVDR